jgi:hypothetical protein
MHLDLAVASRKSAEAAFFDDGSSEDDIPRIRLENLSEFELAHLAIALVDQFEPRLALDADHPEDIVSEADPRFVAALATLPAEPQAALLARWASPLQAAGALPADPDRLPTALVALQELAALAVQRRHSLLYTQSIGEDPLASDPD